MSTNIEWTKRFNADGTITNGETWNPLIGCDKVSAGCTNCYAIQTAWIRMHNPAMKDKYAFTVKKTEGGKLNWTGQINLHPPSLETPLKKKRSTTYFVNSMSDLFHKDVPVVFIAEVWAIMYLANWHTYQILTKRESRMEQVLNSTEFKQAFVQACNYLHYLYIKPLEDTLYSYHEVMSEYPLKNVWLGVSVEDQEQTKRIPPLLRTPAAVRFLSCEPLLGAVDLTDISTMVFRGAEIIDCLSGALMDFTHDICPNKLPAKIDWVICGGESGPGARPMHPDWARSLRDQCAAADVPFFFKQWGEWKPNHQQSAENVGPDLGEPIDYFSEGRLDEYEEDLKIYLKKRDAWEKKHVQYFPDGLATMRYGKKASGRWLDGVEHNGMPAVKEAVVNG